MLRHNRFKCVSSKRDSGANDYGYLESAPFSSYRAELRGLLKALSRALLPTCVVLDNASVCDEARALMDRIDSSLERRLSQQRQ